MTMADRIDYSDSYDVFLSYRRDGGETMAILLRDRLAAKGYRVFLDIESLNSGSFNKRLLSVIENCADVVVVCSKGSLDRCVSEGDWVRTEIVHALEHGKNVVPVMLRGFEWPDVLPDDMEELRMQNGVNANSHEYFDAAIDRLADKFLQSRPRDAEEKKPGAPEAKKWFTKTRIILSAVAFAVLVLTVALVLNATGVLGNNVVMDDPGSGDLQAANTDMPEANTNEPLDSENEPGALQSGGDVGVDTNSSDVDTGEQSQAIGNQSYAVGDIVNFGTHYYTEEPLQWFVLDAREDKMFVVLANQGVASFSYDFLFIQKWLNADDDFFRCFNATESDMIVETTYKNGLKEYTDKVFLLSDEQVNEYMSDKTLRKFEDGWWILGRATYPSYQLLIDPETGEIHETTVEDNRSIRPAMWIKLDR
jgi:hypothetical protein